MHETMFGAKDGWTQITYGFGPPQGRRRPSDILMPYLIRDTAKIPYQDAANGREIHTRRLPANVWRQFDTIQLIILPSARLKPFACWAGSSNRVPRSNTFHDLKPHPPVTHT